MVAKLVECSSLAEILTNNPELTNQSLVHHECSFFRCFSKLWFVLDAVLGSRQGKAGVGGRHWWPLPAWWRLVGGGRWQASTWWHWQAWPLVAAGDLVAASTFGRSVNITHPSSPLHH